MILKRLKFLCFAAIVLNYKVAYADEMTLKESESIKSEVMLSFKQLSDSVKAVNIDKYLSFFDQKKFTSLNENGTVYHSYTDFEKLIRQQLPMVKTYKHLVFKNVKVTVINPDTAILVNEYDSGVVLKSGEEFSVSGAGTQVWSKSKGGWLLVNVSSSMKPVNK
ncbi:YybH family protein [Aliikangiella sp. IMCC44359]|uniref:YybH family protein n=1 Tax=Aliikangiella sp. IMCC44359 TaxID=3459125 RepID=UPI00403ACF62